MVCSSQKILKGFLSEAGVRRLRKARYSWEKVQMDSIQAQAKANTVGDTCVISLWPYPSNNIWQVKKDFWTAGPWPNLA